LKKIIFLLLIFSVSTLYSEKIYRVLSRGSIKDFSTGLIWTRCSLTEGDRPVYDFNCKGTRKKYTWDQAVEACSNLNFDGRSDWRLPNIRELQSILFYHHYSAGYDNISQVLEEVFPNVVSRSDMETIKISSVQYWSSTLHANTSDFAWFADFFHGNAVWGRRTTDDQKLLYVRCVAGP
jgi:hypothetical protein